MFAPSSIVEGLIDPLKEPEEGIWINRISPSHTRALTIELGQESCIGSRLTVGGHQRCGCL